MVGIPAWDPLVEGRTSGAGAPCVAEGNVQVRRNSRRGLVVSSKAPRPK